MSEVALRIQSYFSRDADLAAEMSGWPEFVSGSGYAVELRGEGKSVSIALVEHGDEKFVQVSGNVGPLLDRALGVAIRAMVSCSDTLLVSSAV